mmetsp:Transcript_14997/g.40455  ORF Transcript_14997/g.40455 Transcript_14997/m.40455 type:complete len:187 (-) Transcript_14997:707-1267(-)|eukprot:CAMPEP_0202374824 /NCGR_PEP_ID=MMETSP1127-20130417/5587_1 /ASSEMBLY_ACC=CAM_ASM_000462 /TAXON_ID=3047 /ORGANISM="Dunaliella tertiolecta, Strain CCMP1320" /LENGTH=186 /DNA_ID=CAMNT_0048972093 /DNA_START=159 /DNA_END=719 /DNA_ORIENTATION=+
MTNPTSSGFPNRDSYKEFDFLKGEGPSGQQHYYDPLEKKAFRPGWQAKKHVGRTQDSERQKQEAQKVERAQIHATARREQIEQRQLRNAYNPITGQEFNNATKSWQPASDPWSHRRPCVKPQPDISKRVASSDQGAGSRTLDPTQSYERVAALSKVTDMRRQRMAAEGLPPARRQAGTMKEILQWS